MNTLQITYLPCVGFSRLTQKLTHYAKNKILVNSASLICTGLIVSGCVGIGAIVTTDYPEYLNTPNSGFSISLQSGENNTSRKIIKNYAGAIHKQYDDIRVLKAWGKPDEISLSGPYSIWTYNEPALRWNGIALHALITIPLAIPSGKEKYKLFFKDNVLEKVISQSTRTNLFVCAPLYMLIGGMAAAMSPTGNGSVPGPCTLIKRKGIYFHFITNY